jgi:hypothetical protein
LVFEDLIPGTYKLTIRELDLEEKRIIEVGSGAQVEYRLEEFRRSSALRIRVETIDRSPVKSATCTVGSLTKAGAISIGATDDAGMLILSVPEGEDVVLGCSAPGFVDSSTKVRAGAGAQEVSVVMMKWR